MPRQYIVQSWVGAVDDYSGEQIGNRRSRSVDVTEHVEGAKRRAKAERDIRSKIDLAGRHLDRMERLSADLESDFDNGAITLQEYAHLRKLLDARLEKAWNRVAKERGWQEEEEDGYVADKHSLSVDHKPIGFIAETFLALPVDNTFRRLYDWFQKAKQLYKGD